MAAEPLARLSRLWRSGPHSAARPHSGTSSRTADTRVPPYLSRSPHTLPTPPRYSP